MLLALGARSFPNWRWRTAPCLWRRSLETDLAALQLHERQHCRKPSCLCRDGLAVLQQGLDGLRQFTRDGFSHVDWKAEGQRDINDWMRGRLGRIDDRLEVMGEEISEIHAQMGQVLQRLSQ